MMLESNSNSYADSDFFKSGVTFRKIMIFTGLDGLLTMYAILSACAGADLTPRQILSISLGCLLACSLSAAYNGFLSHKSENEYINAQRHRESTEIKNYPDVEKKGLFNIYTKKYNFDPKDAQSLVDIAFKREDYFLHHTLVEELGILKVEHSMGSVKIGLYTLLTFCILGAFPLMGFFGFFIGTEKTSYISGFLFTSLFTILVLIALGYYKGIYMRQNPKLSSLFMVLNAAVLGVTSFLVGMGIMAVYPKK